MNEFEYDQFIDGIENAHDDAESANDPYWALQSGHFILDEWNSLVPSTNREFPTGPIPF